MDDPRPDGPDSTIADQTAAASSGGSGRAVVSGGGSDAVSWATRAWPNRRIFSAAFTAAIALGLAYLTVRTFIDSRPSSS